MRRVLRGAGAVGLVFALGAAALGLSSVTAQEEATAATLRACTRGRMRTGEGCCWSGQEWDLSRGMCVGTPRCPAGAFLLGLECAVRCPDPMVPVVGGTFRMGSEAGDPDERPVHQVTVTSFCIDRTEVTVGAYRACVADTACRPAQTDDSNHTFRPQHMPSAVRDPGLYPINGVSWEDARTYCAWRGSRLPTEAEWEYAARGTDGRVFPWGNEPPPGRGEVVRAFVGITPYYCGCAPTRPVGWHPRGASAFGVQDMSGNVWEWVADWYGPYATGPQQNSRSHPSGTHRVLRGGGVGERRAEAFRAANRSRAPPTSRSLYVGFRCAGSAEPSGTAPLRPSGRAGATFPGR